MKPYDEIEDQLFQSAKERIFHFSCDHVIPDENLVCLALSKGPSSVLFDFTYKNRSSPSLVNHIITNVCFERKKLCILCFSRWKNYADLW